MKVHDKGSMSVTHAVDYEVVYTWHVKDFESYFTTSKFHPQTIESNVFFHPEDPSVSWYLQLYPKGDKETMAHQASSGTEESLSVFINLDTSSDVPEMHAKYIISILGQDRWMQKVTGEKTFKRGSGWGRSNLMTLEELAKERNVFLVDDTFSVRCTVEYTKSVTTDFDATTKSSSTRSLLESSTNSLTKIVDHEDISDVTRNSGSEAHNRSRYCNQQMPWHDVTFSVAGQEIHAHRFILASSCPSLAQLVSSGETVVEVPGVTDPEAFREMIRFVYTGDCDMTTNDHCYRLLAVASKYRFLSLMTKCEAYLLSVLDKNNCYITYSWADLCCATHLKSEAAKVIQSLNAGTAPNSISKLSVIPALN